MPRIMCFANVFQNDRPNHGHELRDRSTVGEHRREGFEKSVQRTVRVEITLLKVSATDEERLNHLLKENDTIFIGNNAKNLREDVDE